MHLIKFNANKYETPTCFGMGCLIFWETENTVTQVEHISVSITLYVCEYLLCQYPNL